MIPGVRESRLGSGTRQAARPDEHPVENGPVPQRTVLEDLTERPDDRGELVFPPARDRQPVGRHTAVGEPIADQLEELARVQVDGSGSERRRGLAGDQVESFAGCLQEMPSVFDVEAHASIAQRVFIRPIDHVAHRDHVPRDVDDVDRFDRVDVGGGPGRAADPVRDDEHASQGRLMQQHRPVHEIAHVAGPREIGRRHREPVGDEPLIRGRPEPFLRQQERCFRRPFARRDDA
jgi:hypothetical protein